MSELLEKVNANDAHSVHAHLPEAELHLEHRQYAAALFLARTRNTAACAATGQELCAVFLQMKCLHESFM